MISFSLKSHGNISGVERGFKGKPYPRLMKMVLSATLTQDPSKLAQLDLHHPLFLTTGKSRYQLPENLKSFKLVQSSVIPHIYSNFYISFLLSTPHMQVCTSKLKPLYVLALLENFQEEQCIVFTSSVESTHRLCTLLNSFDNLQIKIKEYSRLQRQSIRR